MTPIPSIPKDLVEYLDALISLRATLPAKGDSERDIWIKVGKRELVDLLIQARKDHETGADAEGLPHVFVQSAVGAGGPDDPGPGPAAGPGAPAPGPFASPQDRLGGLA